MVGGTLGYSTGDGMNSIYSLSWGRDEYQEVKNKDQ